MYVRRCGHSRKSEILTSTFIMLRGYLLVGRSVTSPKQHNKANRPHPDVAQGSYRTIVIRHVCRRPERFQMLEPVAVGKFPVPGTLRIFPPSATQHPRRVSLGYQHNAPDSCSRVLRPVCEDIVYRQPCSLFHHLVVFS